VEVLVIQSLTTYDCLMGRDLISQIPEFASQVDSLRNKVEAYSEDITRNKDHLLATIEDIELEEPTSDVIIFAGSSTNEPALNISNLKPKKLASTFQEGVEKESMDPYATEKMSTGSHPEENIIQ